MSDTTNLLSTAIYDRIQHKDYCAFIDCISTNCVDLNKYTCNSMNMRQSVFITAMFTPRQYIVKVNGNCIVMSLPNMQIMGLARSDKFYNI